VNEEFVAQGVDLLENQQLETIFNTPPSLDDYYIIPLFGLFLELERRLRDLTWFKKACFWVTVVQENGSSPLDKLGHKA